MTDWADFRHTRIQVPGVEIAVWSAGAGPPVLMLHGYPQTHAMWHRVAPVLAERFTVVAPDLRGYGASGKPPGSATHIEYAKRTMAADQVAVMDALGFDRFALVGHDRGGRVGHRLALDHPDRVERLAVLDIVPTLEVFRTTDEHLARAYFHWFFLAQPYDLPERLIGADPEYFLRFALRAWSGHPDSFDPGVVEEYVTAFRDPATVHASCEDYRAAASIDLEHDEADLDRRVACPVLVLWGGRGFVARRYDVLECWGRRAERVSGAALDCGHFVPEEAPERTAAALEEFLAGMPGCGR
ncbi:MAG TPA: alpha/beta hydrolase [Sporichthyaceae bacterium]|jgi:haloacetate dehalogenase|nr:alpha/beta hydrolase [Sporichthyaceae bacterium]